MFFNPRLPFTGWYVETLWSGTEKDKMGTSILCANPNIKLNIELKY
jgi:hypothetical protein